MLPSFARNLLILSGLVAILPAGCNQTQLVHRQVKLTAPHAAGAPLEAETHNGNIAVRKSSGGDVEITATIHAETLARAEAAQVVAERRPDQTLVIRVDWPAGGIHNNEGCDFDAQIPDANGVTFATDNGNLELSDMAGPAVLATTNGNVGIARHAGTIVTTTTNGNIEVSAAAQSVHAKSTNGSLEIALAPDSTGPVELSTVNGSIDLEVSSAFVGTLDLVTTLGAITVDKSVAAKRIKDNKLAFGESPQESRATTVTGSIRVGTTR